MLYSRPTYPEFDLPQAYDLKIPRLERIPPPVAPRIPHRFTRHGITISDDYAWLKDANWQASRCAIRRFSIRISEPIWKPKTPTRKDVLGHTASLQAELVAEMRGRIKEDDSVCRHPMDRFPISGNYRQGGQHELIGRTPRAGGDESIVLDGDVLAAESQYFRFGRARHSPDHQLEAWSADRKGSEFFTIRVREWDSARDLPDAIEQTDGSFVWCVNSRAFYYVKVDDNHRPMQVFRHQLGTSQADDVLVYEEKDTGWFTHIHESATGRYRIIAGGDHETSEQSHS